MKPVWLLREPKRLSLYLDTKNTGVKLRDTFPIQFFDNLTSAVLYINQHDMKLMNRASFTDRAMMDLKYK